MVVLLLPSGCRAATSAGVGPGNGQATVPALLDSVTYVSGTKFTTVTNGRSPDADTPLGTIVLGAIAAKPTVLEWDISGRREVRRIEFDWPPPTGVDYVHVVRSPSGWAAVLGHKDDVSYAGAVEINLFDSHWTPQRHVSVCNRGILDGVDSEQDFLAVAFTDSDAGGNERMAAVYSVSTGAAVGRRAWKTDDEWVGYATDVAIRLGKVYLGYWQQDDYIVDQLDTDLKSVLRSVVLTRGARQWTFAREVLMRRDDALLACFPRPSGTDGGDATFTLAEISSTLQTTELRSGEPEVLCDPGTQFLVKSNRIVTREGRQFPLRSATKLGSPGTPPNGQDRRQRVRKTAVVGDRAVVISDDNASSKLTVLHLSQAAPAEKR